MRMYWSGFHSASLNGPVPMYSVALTELERVDEAVLAHRVALGQHRDWAVRAVETVEPLVDVVGQRLGDAGRRPVRVEGRRLAEVSDLEDAALLLRLGGERAAGDQCDA